MPETIVNTASTAAQRTPEAQPPRPYDELTPEEQREADEQMREDFEARLASEPPEPDESILDGTHAMYTAAEEQNIADFERSQTRQPTNDTARLEGSPLADVLSPLRDAAKAERERALSASGAEERNNSSAQNKPTAENELSRKTVALSLTEEQTRLLLVAEYPNDTPAVYRGMFEITNLDNSVNIMNESVSLDYEEDRKIFYAQMEREEKPAFLEKLDDVLEQNYRLTHPKPEPVPTQNKGIRISKSRDKSKEIEPEL